MEFTKFKQSELSSIKADLIKQQKGVCPICKRSLRGGKPQNIVVDHDHSTGVVRAALHRGCNGVEGKVLRLTRTWGGATTKAAVMRLLENLLEFWKLHDTPQTKFIYYNHKTASEKRLALNKKRRLKNARTKAKDSKVE